MRNVKQKLWKKWRGKKAEQEMETNRPNSPEQTLEKLEEIKLRMEDEDKKMKELHEKEKLRKKKWKKEKEAEEAKLLIREVEKAERKEKQRLLEGRWRLIRWLADYVDKLTDKWSHLERDGKKLTVRDWEILDRAEKIEILRKRVKIEVNDNDDHAEITKYDDIPRDRPTNRVQSRIDIVIDQAEQNGLLSQAELKCSQEKETGGEAQAEHHCPEDQAAVDRDQADHTSLVKDQRHAEDLDQAEPRSSDGSTRSQQHDTCLITQTSTIQLAVARYVVRPVVKQSLHLVKTMPNLGLIQEDSLERAEHGSREMRGQADQQDEGLVTRMGQGDGVVRRPEKLAEDQPCQEESALGQAEQSGSSSSTHPNTQSSTIQLAVGRYVDLPAINNGLHVLTPNLNPGLTCVTGKGQAEQHSSPGEALDRADQQSSPKLYVERARMSQGEDHGAAGMTEKRTEHQHHPEESALGRAEQHTTSSTSTYLTKQPSTIPLAVLRYVDVPAGSNGSQLLTTVLNTGLPSGDETGRAELCAEQNGCRDKAMKLDLNQAEHCGPGNGPGMTLKAATVVKLSVGECDERVQNVWGGEERTGQAEQSSVG